MKWRVGLAAALLAVAGTATGIGIASSGPNSQARSGVSAAVCVSLSNDSADGASLLTYLRDLNTGDLAGRLRSHVATLKDDLTQTGGLVSSLVSDDIAAVEGDCQSILATTPGT